jgi:hypothetical protein
MLVGRDFLYPTLFSRAFFIARPPGRPCLFATTSGRTFLSDVVASHLPLSNIVLLSRSFLTKGRGESRARATIVPSQEQEIVRVGWFLPQLQVVFQGISCHPVSEVCCQPVSGRACQPVSG